MKVFCYWRAEMVHNYASPFSHPLSWTVSLPNNLSAILDFGKIWNLCQNFWHFAWSPTSGWTFSIGDPKIWIRLEMEIRSQMKIYAKDLPFHEQDRCLTKTWTSSPSGDSSPDPARPRSVQSQSVQGQLPGGRVGGTCIRKKSWMVFKDGCNGRQIKMDCAGV